MDIDLLFDGGNGASTEKEAYGSYRIITSVGDNKIEQVRFGTGFTNNEAEYMTLIAGLEKIISALDIHGIATFDVSLTIKGDSNLVKEQIGTYTRKDWGESATGNILGSFYNWTGWKVKAKHLEPLRDKARQLLEQFYTFDYQHISRKEVVKVLGH